MSNQEDSDFATETVDKRLFDSEGNVRDDVAAEREEEEQPEELTLETLYRDLRNLETQTAQAMEQVDVTFNQVGTEMNQLTNQIRTTVSDMHVRIGVLEELHMNSDLADDRAAIQAGTFAMERFKEIAETIVIPVMKEKAAAIQAQMKEKFEKMQALIEKGMSPDDALKKIESDEVNKTVMEKPTGLKIVSS